MSGPVQQFLAMLKSGMNESQTKRPAPTSPETLMAFCGDCAEQTPHERTLLGWRCIFYFSHQPSECGHILLEFLFWLALVLLVLIVILKDVPW